MEGSIIEPLIDVFACGGMCWYFTLTGAVVHPLYVNAMQHGATLEFKLYGIWKDLNTRYVLCSVCAQ